MTTHSSASPHCISTAPSRQWSARTCYVLFAVLAVAMGMSLGGSVYAADVQEVKIGTLHGQLKFDVEQFQVKPGATVRLTLRNTDEMQHNLLILTPGDDKPLAVAQKAWALGENAIKKQFVPDGPDVLFHTRVVDPQQSDTVEFVAPQQEGDYPFVCTLPGHAFTMKGKMRVSKADAPAIVAAKEGNGGKEVTDAKFHVHVMDEPKVIRAFVDGGPARSISVGLPGGINYLFDAEQCYVRFGWRGMFLDVGPNVGRNASDRGGGWCKILGEKFELGDSGFPISVGARDAKQEVKFAGYRVRGKEVPQFYFTIDGQRVTQTIRSAPEGVGLQSEFEFERAPRGPVYFYVSPHRLLLSSSAGTWHDGRLELQAGEAKKFTVTIVREEKDAAKSKTPNVAP
ncbi:MAG TPA: plastocyanin/azurin family copper-binding protein [Chthoniobacter sp.]|nr:plastocyanin/azurin family copper-binding protein [Chthoniobacter sp.]